MKKIVFIFCAVQILVSCTNERNHKEEVKKESEKTVKETENGNLDSLPNAKWNGEYMKIEDTDEPPRRKQSLGSEYFNMGKVDFKIGEYHLDIKMFKKKKNILTFTTQSVTALIKSAFNDQIKLHFVKENIVSQPKGKFIVDSKQQKNKSVSMTLKTGNNQSFVLEEGEGEIIEFSPRLGTLNVKIKGVFIDKNGEKHKGTGKINMNFEGATMTAI
ncbi:hypothetical protein CW751_00855 [Brumimicrobium salinarum]|uniref:Lipoprotein n=1 Tax=Brumimicrobium salinarum TaxID=2058658 RepID=A0A2I0R5R2_9FLAO|nr:hypothetical protein [Brumimicrobium salinarum]PKR81917.1 hypothetical protein CW751_00855 [Brumimicrobium salinarum]